MEKFQKAKEKAKKNVRIADHILTQTYPLVNDPKLLLAVLENIFLSLTNAMGAVLHYERLFKRIPPFHENFDSKFNMFKMRVAHKYNVEGEYLQFIQEVKNMLVSHKKSPMEFTRNDTFVICSDSYKMQTISVNEMRGYVSKTKLFVQDMADIVSKDEEMFNKSRDDMVM